MSVPQGWFAQPDPVMRPTSKKRWQPALQLNGAWHTFDVWFDTEDDCLSYIAVHIIGQGFRDGIPSVEDQ